MHICYIINGLAPAGAEHQLLELINEFDDDVKSTIYHFGCGSALEPAFVAEGVKVVDLDFSIPYDPTGIARLVRDCRITNFDLIHAHLPPAVAVGRLAGTLSQTPVVSTHHNVPENYQMVSKLLEKYSRKIDRKTIAVSDGVRSAFRNSNTDQWITIYNGIDVSEYRKNVDKAELTKPIENVVDEAEFILLNIARYSPQKRQEDLLRAFSRVKHDLPPAHLFIVGWGELHDKLERIVKQENLDKSVTVTGRVPQVEPYYKCANIFVSGSSREGLPITFLEAMASGLPILATDIPGVREVVSEPETGILVECGNVEDISNGLRQLCTNCDLDKMKKNAFQYVERQFSIEHTAKQHLELYKNILEHK